MLIIVGWINFVKDRLSQSPSTWWVGDLNRSSVVDVYGIVERMAPIR